VSSSTPVDFVGIGRSKEATLGQHKRWTQKEVVMRRKTLPKALKCLPILLVLVLSVAGCEMPFVGGGEPTPTATSVAAQVTPPEALPPSTPLPPKPTNTPVIVATPEEAKPTATSTNTPTPIATLGLPSAAAPAVRRAEVLSHGNFEGGFENGIGVGWYAFNNGEAEFGWADETWSALVWDGEHAQHMEIWDAGVLDRYVGIYQTVSTVPGANYELTMHGVIRSSEGSVQASSHGYRLQWGVDYNGGNDWQAVDEWTDVGWDEQPLDAESYTLDSYTTTFKATSASTTLFIRGWKKWPTRANHVKFAVDDVSLTGASIGAMAGKMPDTGLGTGVIFLAGLLGLLLILIRQSREIIAWRRERK
jgi:hypothetical protein